MSHASTRRAARHLVKATRHLNTYQRLTAARGFNRVGLSDLLALDVLEHGIGIELTVSPPKALVTLIETTPHIPFADPAGSAYDDFEDELVAVATAAGVITDRRHRSAA